MDRHHRPEEHAQGFVSRWWHPTWAIAVGLLMLCAPFATPSRVLGLGPMESVQKDCEKELGLYCRDVTPEQGRILACLYAHGNGLSGQCEYALYEVLNQLEKAISPTLHFMKACEKDAKKHCPLVEQGEGRIVNCLKEKSAHVSPGCRQAMSGLGVK